jgi:hypothetical protein
MNVPVRRVLLALLCLPGLLVVGAMPGSAVTTTILELGELQGDGWNAAGLQLQINLLGDSHAHIQLLAQTALLPEPLGKLSDLQLECRTTELTATKLDCRDGVLRLQSDQHGRQQIPVHFGYRFADRQLRFDLQGIALLGGRLAVRGELAGGSWNIAIDGEGLSLPQLSTQLAAAGLSLPRLDGSGEIGLTARLQGSTAVLETAAFSLHLQADSFTDAEGSMAGEELDVTVAGKARAITGGWRLDLEINADRGRLYVEPLFLEVPAEAIQATAHLEYQVNTRQLMLHALEYRHPGSVLLAANGHIDLGKGPLLRELQVELQEGMSASFYATYLRPWFAGTMLGALDTAGKISGDLYWREGKLDRLKLDLADLSLHDRDGRFDLTGVNGRLRWSAGEAAQVSDLHWEGGSVYRVGLGQADLRVETTGSQARLLEPARIQVLDGELQIETFNLEIGEAAALRWQVDGILTPVSMRQLSLALGWPEFAGKLSGVIPAVRYDDGHLSVGGILLMKVFDGTVTLQNVQLERPFGVIPRLQLDARFTDIDLEAMTGAFSFGRIEGRLEGRIDDLEMESWRPVAFDAAFATPAGDKSRHRISQRAVDNISSIGGGGVGGALSRSFLRFFEDFPYDRLGIRCRLENGICDMGGVAPAASAGGYYLVKGRLLPPRLDVIGYADRVDWESLLAQIMTVTRQQQNTGME